MDFNCFGVNRHFVRLADIDVRTTVGWAFDKLKPFRLPLTTAFRQYEREEYECRYQVHHDDHRRQSDDTSRFQHH